MLVQLTKAAAPLAAGAGTAQFRRTLQLASAMAAPLAAIALATARSDDDGHAHTLAADGARTPESSAWAPHASDGGLAEELAHEWLPPPPRDPRATLCRVLLPAFALDGPVSRVADFFARRRHMVVGVAESEAAFEGGRRGLRSTGQMMPRRLDAALLRVPPPLPRGAEFAAAASFGGFRDGYVFTTRAGRTGYYLDMAPVPRRPCGASYKQPVRCLVSRVLTERGEPGFATARLALPPASASAVAGLKGGGGLALVRADACEIAPPLLGGQFGAIVDAGGACATASDRTELARSWTELIAPGGHVLLTVPEEVPPPASTPAAETPPFVMAPGAVRALFGDRFRVRELRRVRSTGDDGSGNGAQDAEVTPPQADSSSAAEVAVLLDEVTYVLTKKRRRWFWPFLA